MGIIHTKKASVAADEVRTTRYHLNAPCSIALLTDFHNRSWEPVIEALEPLHPDMICIAGDVFYGGVDSCMENQKNVLPFLESCGSTAPTFLSLGNHDWALTPPDLAAIRQLGITILDNAWTNADLGEIKKHRVAGNVGDQQGRNVAAAIDDRQARSIGDPQARGDASGVDDVQDCGGVPTILVGGLTSGITLDLRENDWNSGTTSRPPQLEWLEDFAARDGYHILLCHHPEYYPRYLKPYDSIDLVLSGHAHGGQWRFFDRGIFAPGQGFFPKLTSGVHQRLVISRGLSNTTRFPRLNNPCEIVYID